MPDVKLHTMDFTCDCGNAAFDVPVRDNVICSECGSKYLLSLLVTKKSDRTGRGEVEVLSPVEPLAADDGTDA